MVMHEGCVCDRRQLDPHGSAHEEELRGLEHSVVSRQELQPCLCDYHVMWLWCVCDLCLRCVCLWLRCVWLRCLCVCLCDVWLILSCCCSNKSSGGSSRRSRPRCVRPPPPSSRAAAMLCAAIATILLHCCDAVCDHRDHPPAPLLPSSRAAAILGGMTLSCHHVCAPSCVCSTSRCAPMTSM